MLWLARQGLSLIPTTAMVWAFRSISSIRAGSFMASSGIRGQRSVSLSNPTSILHIQFVRACGNGRTSAFGEQIPAEKRLQIAVEHLVYIAHFHLCSVIFRHSVWLQHV